MLWCDRSRHRRSTAISSAQKTIGNNHNILTLRSHQQLERSLAKMFAYLQSLVLAGLCMIQTSGFNLDTRTVAVYSYPTQTGNDFFGFTVALHSYQNTSWLLVGAPLSDVISPKGTVLPKYGALFKCETAGSKKCTIVNVDNEPDRKSIYPPGSGNEVPMETKSGQWLGATLKSNNGTVMVCAPRYSHKKPSKSKSEPFVDDLYLRPWLSGGCYLLNSSLSRLQDDGILRPWAETRSSYSANSQAGFSADILDHQGVIMGKVGAGFSPTQTEKPMYLAGGIDFYSFGSKVYKSTTRAILDKNDYMGYDVANGYFSDKGYRDIAGGAPRGNNLKGKILIYNTNKQDSIVFRSQLELPGNNKIDDNKSKLFGSYFGSTLCAVDLNNDGFTDLLVGAPLYSENKDEGRVFVYLNKKGFLTLLSDTVLEGDNRQGGRFGTAIASVGDLNRDGYQDVVIGAPYEGHNSSGAVYVYYGTKNGIEAKYRQKITGESINNKLKGFGYSISGTVDIDGNAYPDVAVGSYWSSHAVLFKTRRIVEIEAFIKPDRTKIILENKNNMCKSGDGTLQKCLNVTVCFKFQDREPSNRQDLKIGFHMEADGDIPGLEFRRMYFYNGRDRSFTVKGEVTLKIQGKEHCLMPYAVLISKKIHILNLLKALTFDLSFGLADKSCESVPDVPCPIIDAYQPTSIRNEQVIFQKQCAGDVCKPDLSVTGHVGLPSNLTVLFVGTTEELTVDIDIENIAKDASYQTILTLSYPANLSYIGPTSTKQVLCASSNGNESYATCHVGNPFKAKSKKSLSIKFSAQDVTSDFVIIVTLASANNDTDNSNNIVSLPVITKYLTDMEIKGVSQPDEVIYKGNLVTKNKVKSANDSGPVVTQTITIQNHGPSFVDGATARIQVPKLNKKDDPESFLLYLQEVELSGGPGTCNAITNTLSIPQQNTTQLTLGQTARSTEPSQVTTNVKQECLSAVCHTFECRLGTIPKGREIKITMMLILVKSTFVQIKQVETQLVTTAQLIVPHEIMQTDVSNDIAKITLTVRPSSEGKKEDIPWWVILLSVLGGLMLLAALIGIMYKFGFFSRSRPGNDDALPEEVKPMKV